MGEMSEGQRGSKRESLRGSSSSSYSPPTFFRTASPDRYGLLKEFAKENRNNQTDGEAILWQHIKGKSLGVKFLRQHIIFDFIADFACVERMLVIEVDGGYHYQPEQMEWDAYRTDELETMGFRVIRFTNEEVAFDTENVLKKIDSVLKEQELRNK